MKTAIEYLLFKSGVSNYQIAKDTGITQVLLSKYATGKSDVGRMTLDNATILYDYFKGMVGKMENKYGNVEWDGKKITLTQDAYFTSDFRHDYQDRVVYKATGIDMEGIEHEIVWLPVEGFEEMEDASDHCNWADPAEVEEI